MTRQPAPVRGSIVPFAFLCITLIVGSLVSVLLLNITMASGAYEARDLLIETARLKERRAELLLDLDENASPEKLAERALEMGMRPAEKVGYISLAEGTVRRAGGNG